MPKSSLLSTAEAAKALGVNTRTVLRLVDRGKLPSALRMPGGTGAYLFNPDDVEAYRLTKEHAAKQVA